MPEQQRHIGLLEAIARQEGFYVKGTRAARNHNPGNINWGLFAKNHGASGPDDKGYAIFPSAEIGFSALKALLQTPKYKGKTLEGALLTYCPPKGNNLANLSVSRLESGTGYHAPVAKLLNAADLKPASS